MKKLISLALVGSALVGSVLAATPFGVPKGTSLAWQCNPPNYVTNSQGGTVTGGGLNWCRLNLTSGTTTTQIGSVNVNPAQHIYVLGGVSGSAVSGLVTPTISLSLGGKVVATQNISVTTAGNVVDLGLVPYFDNVTVSESLPGNISSTNSLVITIIGNDK